MPTLVDTVLILSRYRLTSLLDLNTQKKQKNKQKTPTLLKCLQNSYAVADQGILWSGAKYNMGAPIGVVKIHVQLETAAPVKVPTPISPAPLLRHCSYGYGRQWSGTCYQATENKRGYLSGLNPAKMIRMVFVLTS